MRRIRVVRVVVSVRWWRHRRWGRGWQGWNQPASDLVHFIVIQEVFIHQGINGGILDFQAFPARIGRHFHLLAAREIGDRRGSWQKEARRGRRGWGVRPGGETSPRAAEGGSAAAVQVDGAVVHAERRTAAEQLESRARVLALYSRQAARSAARVDIIARL